MVQPALVMLPPGRLGTLALMFPDRQSGRHVGEKAVERVAEPAPHGRKPIVARGAAGRTEQDGGPADARPVDVAFRAYNEAVDLPVVADGPADEAAGHIEIIDTVPLRAPPSAAAVDAEVKATAKRPMPARFMLIPIGKTWFPQYYGIHSSLVEQRHTEVLNGSRP